MGRRGARPTRALLGLLCLLIGLLFSTATVAASASRADHKLTISAAFGGELTHPVTARPDVPVGPDRSDLSILERASTSGLLGTVPVISRPAAHSEYRHLARVSRAPPA